MPNKSIESSFARYNFKSESGVDLFDVLFCWVIVVVESSALAQQSAPRVPRTAAAVTYRRHFFIKFLQF